MGRRGCGGPRTGRVERSSPACLAFAPPALSGQRVGGQEHGSCIPPARREVPQRRWEDRDRVPAFHRPAGSPASGRIGTWFLHSTGRLGLGARRGEGGPRRGGRTWFSHPSGVLSPGPFPTPSRGRTGNVVPRIPRLGGGGPVRRRGLGHWGLRWTLGGPRDWCQGLRSWHQPTRSANSRASV